MDVTFATGFGRIADLEIGPDGNLYVLSTEKNWLGIYKIIGYQVDNLSKLTIDEHNETYSDYL